MLLISFLCLQLNGEYMLRDTKNIPVAITNKNSNSFLRFRIFYQERMIRTNNSYTVRCTVSQQFKANNRFFQESYFL